MSPTLRALLSSWNWRPDVVLVVAAVGILYGIGWWRLRRQGARVARRWRLALYAAGLLSIVLALLSPIDTFGSFLFIMHMVQHELLVMVAPALFLLANPLPVILWGLPQTLRRRAGRLLRSGAPLRRILRVGAWMPVSWPLHVVALWAWHHPTAYQASLKSEVIHDLQHLSFFLTALLFWWPVVNPAPRVHGHVPYGWRIVYVFGATLQNTALSALLGLSGRVLYPYYTTVPRLFGLTALEDQTIGATVMWIPGGMMYVIATLLLLNSYLNEEERRAGQRPGPVCRTEGLMLFLLGFLLTFPSSTSGNGGTPRLANARAGPYLVSVWSRPDPVQVGELHLSAAVMVPDARAPVLNAEVRLIARPTAGHGTPVSALASRGAGANKLLYHADLKLPHADRWRVTVLVEGLTGRGSTDFQVVAKPRAVRKGVLAGTGLSLVALVLVTLLWFHSKSRHRG